MRVTPATAVVVCLAMLLTALSLRALNPEAEVFDQILGELERLGRMENALYRDVFAARAGMLRNYDPLVNEINRLRASLESLRDSSAIDDENKVVIDGLDGLVDRQEELVELFKSENALLQNSISVFGRLGANPTPADLDPAISAVAAAILHLTLDTSSGTVRDVQDRLNDLDREASRRGQGDAVEALRAHGRLLHKVLPTVDNTLKLMRALPQERERDTLRALILKQQLASRRSARGYRAFLYSTSLLLLAFLIYLGFRLRSRADALRRRAALEHLIAGISMRFINARHQDIDAEIDRALADMAAYLGSDRAYFVIFGARRRQHVWHKPGMEPAAGWPAGAAELAMRIGAGRDGIVHVPRVHRMPMGENKATCLKFGLGGWACAVNTDTAGVDVVLGFDAIGRPCRISGAGELALLRMVLETFVHAVERHAIETERARLEVRLEQARRMEKIGIITSGIAHNFNNILGGILGHSEVMEEHVGGDAKLTRSLGAVRRGAERARDLVDQILVFGRRRNAPRKPLSVAALIAEAALLLDASLPVGVDLVIRQSPTAAIVSGEHAQLLQVLLNLCSNAANAMPAGGRIELATEQREVSESRSLSHDEVRPGDYVCIKVTDTGQGMDEATLGRIFEPFFTTRSSGNGLGLATVREIVREHGGAVSVRSKVGAGSRFEVWLLRAVAEPASLVRTRTLPTGRGETVMLVAKDGEHVLREEEMLAALGYEAVGFSMAEAAVAACRASPDRFDMVIVGDFGSAVRTLDLAAELHAAVPSVPIVLATKGAIEIGADRLVSAGISDVVRWPMIADEIAIALSYAAPIRGADAPTQAHWMPASPGLQ